MSASILLAAAESILAGITASAILTWFYNNFLSGLRENHLKKAFSLLVHPAGVLAALAHFGAIMVGWPRFWPVAFVGVGIILWRARHLVRQQRLNRPWKSRSISLKNRGVNWNQLPAPAQLVLRCLSPINQVDALDVVERRLRVRGLHRDMDGFRIVFLTDFHVHKWMRSEWFREVVQHALALKPDCVILGGDFVSRRWMAEEAAEALADLAGAPNLLAVRGNHDFWTRPGFFGDLVRDWGGRVLSNDVAVLRRGEGALAVVGLEDPYLPLTTRSQAELLARLESLPMPRLGIVHTPQVYRLAARLGCQFSLAGHTHGGQVRLPFFGTTICSCPGKPEHIWGAGRRAGMETFTSNGIGAFYPLRVACPPQIVHLTLGVG
ncbi:hypothetical protein GC173_17110 [bacterium]|nr:hypothetical protein [bacterium]